MALLVMLAIMAAREAHPLGSECQKRLATLTQVSPTFPGLTLAGGFDGQCGDAGGYTLNAALKAKVTERQDKA